MKKIPFSEKNDLIVKHKNEIYFWVDLDLFKKHFASHPLNNDLARANVHTYGKLDGNMLSALLDVVTIDEILENRGLIEKKPRTLDELKSLILGFGIKNFDPETFYDVIDLETLNLVNPVDEEYIRTFVDDFVNPKVQTIEEVKEIFIQNNLVIEGVTDSLFEDFIGKPVADISELILNKYAFMKKPEVTSPAVDNPVIENTGEITDEAKAGSADKKPEVIAPVVDKPVIENTEEITDEAKAGRIGDTAKLQGLDVSHTFIDEIIPKEKQQDSVSDGIVATPSPVKTTESTNKKKDKSKKNSPK